MDLIINIFRAVLHTAFTLGVLVFAFLLLSTLFYFFATSVWDKTLEFIEETIDSFRKIKKEYNPEKDITKNKDYENIVFHTCYACAFAVTVFVVI